MKITTEEWKLPWEEELQDIKAGPDKDENKDRQEKSRVTWFSLS